MSSFTGIAVKGYCCVLLALRVQDYQCQERLGFMVSLMLWSGTGVQIFAIVIYGEGICPGQLNVRHSQEPSRFPGICRRLVTSLVGGRRPIIATDDRINIFARPWCFINKTISSLGFRWRPRASSTGRLRHRSTSPDVTHYYCTRNITVVVSRNSSSSSSSKQWWNTELNLSS